MSNGQLPHDQNVMRDRISPRELEEADKAAFEQQQAERAEQAHDPHWVPPGNKDQGSRKKKK